MSEQASKESLHALVLKLAISGQTNDQIAAASGYSIHNVKRILAKAQFTRWPKFDRDEQIAIVEDGLVAGLPLMKALKDAGWSNIGDAAAAYRAVGLVMPDVLARAVNAAGKPAFSWRKVLAS